MKFIVFTKEQADQVKGVYNNGFSILQPITAFRSKYLSGVRIPFTEVEEFVLPITTLESDEFIKVRGFLQCFPVYDADYYTKQVDSTTGVETKVYFDINN